MKVKYRKLALLLTSLMMAALVFALVPAGLPVFADPGSWTQTSDADFNAGTKTQVAVANNSVKLATTTTTQIFYPTTTKDTYIEYWDPTAKHGSDTTMQVAAVDAYRALVEFDLSSIPSGANIISAVLNLYCSSGCSSPSISARRITSSWSESTVTWDTQPGHASTATYVMMATGTGWKNWIVTSDVQNFVNGTYTNYGWKLTSAKSENDIFRTKEYTGITYDPKLVVDCSYLAYYTSGDLVSSKYDTGQASNLGTISFTIDEPAGTDLKFQIRTAATEGGLDSATWYGPTGTGDYYTTSGTSINSIHNGDRWVQYKAYFETTDTTKTSRLDEITITYEEAPTIEITAPADISGWPLSPSGTQPNEQSGTLGVTCSGGWTVTVKDANATTGGKMTDYYGSSYGTTKLANYMVVAAQTYNVTLPALPDGGIIASGSGNNPNITVTFKQEVSWSDPVLLVGHSYRIIVTFTGTISP